MSDPISGYEAVMVHVFGRLEGSPAMDDVVELKRSHRTPVTRDKTPAVHLVDGVVDEPARQSKCARQTGFTVSVQVRSDEGTTAADPFKIEVYRRLNPQAEAYPNGITVRPRAIRIDTESADSDVTRVDMEFDAEYPGSEWDLGGTS